jgi:hypothetical protein
VLVPDLVKGKPTLQEIGRDLGDSYVSLHPPEDRCQPVHDLEIRPMQDFMDRHGLLGDVEWLEAHSVVQWGRLAVPNGSLVRTVWREKLRVLENLRISHMAEVSAVSPKYVWCIDIHLKLIHENAVRYAEVLYFCNLPIIAEVKRPVAVIKLFSLPDQAWLEQSHKVYRTCMAGAGGDICVVDVKDIQSVIAMHPDPKQGDEWWCTVYKPGRTASRLAGKQEDPNDADNGNL